MNITSLKFNKTTDLLPVVVQDWRTLKVLMLAYVNKEALLKTLETGYAHYWSRERQRLWKKGETSGNVQKIVDVVADCDADALLYVVEQIGFACHTGAESCFHNSLVQVTSDKIT
jgi:phosphoribosyl-AMP cyclohydrolase